MTAQRLDFPLRPEPPYGALAVGLLAAITGLMALATIAAVLATPTVPAGLVVLLAAGTLLPAAALAWHLRRAAWLTGTVLSRRNLLGTRQVDLADATVDIRRHGPRQLVLWAHRPDDSVAVGVPLRREGRATGRFISPELLLALADAIGNDPEAAEVLRKLATDPTIRRST